MIDPQTLNMTARGYFAAERLIFDTTHWLCVLRPRQVTLGATLLLCKSETVAFGGLSVDEFVDMRTAMQRIERMYAASFKPDRLNYIALMMVGPNPHFHVVPRYATTRSFAGKDYGDAMWPKATDLSLQLDIEGEALLNLTKMMRDADR